MRADDRLSGAVLVVLSTVACLEAARYGIGSFQYPSAGFFPFLMGLVVGALSLVLLFSAIFSKDKAKEPSESIWIVMTRKKVWCIVLALVADGFLLEPLGFLLTTFVVFAFIFHVAEPQKWWASIIGGLISAVGCYALFDLALGVPLPQGVLGL